VQGRFRIHLHSSVSGFSVGAVSEKVAFAMLTQIPILDPAECERASAQVCELRPHWIPRTPPPAAFFTLGVASYQDLSGFVPHGSRQDYYADAPFFNALILSRFGWLLDRVRGSLEGLLGAPAQFSPRLGVPGFHIFDDAGIPRTDAASIHCDLQYQLIDWNDGAPPPDFTNPISFTLPTRLPKGGGGINGWDLTCEEIDGAMKQHGASTMDDVVKYKCKTFYPYSSGAMAVHSGHRVHQIGPAADVRQGDQRITLQGHGLRRGAAWVLYW
jgi:hypothetical protein